ncbi:MAG: OmpA family protein [Hyphomicrobiales bacterium]
MSKLITTKNLVKTMGLAALVGVTLWGAPTLAQKQGLARETLEELVTVPPSDLSDDDLALRIQLNRRLIKDNISEIGGIKLKALLKADQKERRKRNSAEAKAPENTDTAQAEDDAKAKADAEAAAEKKAERDRQRQERRAAKKQAAEEAAEKERLAKEAAAKQLADAEAEKKRIEDEKAAAAAAKEAEKQAAQKKATNNPRINRLARTSLEDQRRANRLDIPELTARIEESNQLLNDKGLRPRLASRLQDRIVQDQAVLDRKTERQRVRAQQQDAKRKAAEAETAKKNQNAQQPRQNNPRANKLARDLLLDTRPANALGLPELKDRVKRTRQALKRDGLRPRLSKQLLDRLSQDRDELRNRVATNQGRNQNNQARKRILENRAIRNEFLADRRNARRLNENQLDQRINQAVTLLDSIRMRPATRAGVEQMLRRDRAEKRNRLLAAREERRANLRRQARRPNGFSIELGSSGIRFNSDIVAAEEDTQALQRQLLAAPRQQIQRRYTLNEFRDRPELRQYMPGIELDTIRFGTNEAFIRAEEVGNLDGIGEIIEQIVYSEPGEVFLIEGHTDAVGSDGYNYTLSAARAEGVREALLDYFNIPPQSLVAIGYGENYLRIPTPYAEQENRRVSVRRITPLLAAR